MTSVGVICGLAAEARIAAAHGFSVACGGSDPERTGILAVELLRGGAKVLVSFGIAGGLDPALRSGDLVVATHVIAEAESWFCSAPWSGRVAGRLPDSRQGAVAGVATPVGGVAAKRALRDATGALAVDLESMAVARVARAAGAPFLVVRAVADTADQALPAVAATLVLADGRIAVGRALLAMAARPGLVSTFAAMALAQRRALAALASAASVLADEPPG